jgi:hypothetical protein
MPKYIDSEVLGKSADMGYFITEYADHVLTVGYKDDNAEEIAAFSQIGATKEALQNVCARHHAKLTSMAEVMK